MSESSKKFVKKDTLKAGNVRRSIKIDVRIPKLPIDEKDEKAVEKEKKRVGLEKAALVADLALYRAVCREVGGIMASAEMASCDIQCTEINTKVISKSAESQALLQAIFRLKCKDGSEYAGSTPGYPMRDLIKSRLDGWKSTMADCALKDIWTTWNACDPDMPAARRRFLFWQGKRNIPAFGHLPIRLKPSWIKFEDHFVSFGYKLDETVKLKIPTLDPEAYRILTLIRNGTHQLGEVLFNQDVKGRLYLVISYQRKAESVSEKLDPNRVLEVAFDQTDPEKFMRFCVREGHQSWLDQLRNDSLNATAAMSAIDQVSAQADRCEKEAKACGNIRDQHTGSGHGKAADAIREKRNRLTRQRTNITRTWNHVWASRILTVARRWRCGTIKAFLPYGLFGRSWPWVDLGGSAKDGSFVGGKLCYRCDEFGIKLSVEYAKPPKKESSDEESDE